MPPKIISKTPTYLLRYVEHCFKSNTEYSKEDIEWIMYHFCNLYSFLYKEPDTFYRMLSLVDITKFCGYFALTYNNELLKAVKERDGKEFKNLLINPIYKEITDNNVFSKEELEEMNNIFQMESLIHNFTLKRFIVLENENMDLNSLYIDSYTEIYNNFFIDKILQNKSEFQGFLFLTEYDSKTRNSHVYTYKLIDILSQYITGKFTYNISQNNIELIKSRFSTELKLVMNYYTR